MPGVSQRVGRGIALLFHDRGTRRGWVVSNTPRPHFTPRKDPVPIVQKAGWAPGSVWTGGKSRPHRDSIPERPARSSVTVPTELPGPQFKLQNTAKNKKKLGWKYHQKIRRDAIFSTRPRKNVKSLWKTNVHNKKSILNISVVKFPMKIKKKLNKN